jgi:hypothetical protein
VEGLLPTQRPRTHQPLPRSASKAARHAAAAVQQQMSIGRHEQDRIGTWRSA